MSTNNTPTRALRTTTFVTAAAGDDIYIVGEMRSPGAHTSYTVTMDSRDRQLMAAAWSGLLPPCRLVVFTSAVTEH